MTPHLTLPLKQIIPLIVDGFEITDYNEWWPKTMPELEDHSLFIDMRDPAWYTPYTLHHTLHPTPSTTHHTPCVVHTLHPTPHTTPSTTHYTPYILHPAVADDARAGGPLVVHRHARSRMVPYNPNPAFFSRFCGT